MPPRAINPNHPVTQEMEENWHKLLGIVMHMLNHQHLVIRELDVAFFAESYPLGSAVICHAKRDCIELTLATPEEATKIAKEAGGLPQ